MRASNKQAQATRAKLKPKEKNEMKAKEWQEMAQAALDNWDLDEMSESEVKTLRYWASGQGITDTEAPNSYSDPWDWLAECCATTAATW